MPKTICSSYVYLDFSSVTGRCLELRLKPTEFDLDSPEPVLRISIGNIEDLEDAEKKRALLREYSIYDVETDGPTLSVWCEEAETPLKFSGSIAWAREAYAASDYVDRIRVIDERGAREWNEIRGLRRRINNTSAFIDKALDRLQRRLDFGPVEDPQVEQKMQLLKGVQRHLQED